MVCPKITKERCNAAQLLFGLSRNVTVIFCLSCHPELHSCHTTSHSQSSKRRFKSCHVTLRNALRNSFDVVIILMFLLIILFIIIIAILPSHSYPETIHDASSVCDMIFCHTHLDPLVFLKVFVIMPRAANSYGVNLFLSLQ